MQLEEGGNNAYVHQLPTRLKYSNVKLSRPINEDSRKVAVWFMAIAKVVKRGRSAFIMAVDGDEQADRPVEPHERRARPLDRADVQRREPQGRDGDARAGVPRFPQGRRHPVKKQA